MSKTNHVTSKDIRTPGDKELSRELTTAELSEVHGGISLWQAFVGIFTNKPDPGPSGVNLGVAA